MTGLSAIMLLHLAWTTEGLMSEPALALETTTWPRHFDVQPMSKPTMSSAALQSTCIKAYISDYNDAIMPDVPPDLTCGISRPPRKASRRRTPPESSKAQRIRCHGEKGWPSVHIAGKSRKCHWSFEFRGRY